MKFTSQWDSNHLCPFYCIHALHIKMHYFPFFFLSPFIHSISSLRVIRSLSHDAFQALGMNEKLAYPPPHFKMPRKLHFMENHFLGNTILNAAHYTGVHLSMFVYWQWQFMSERTPKRHRMESLEYRSIDSRSKGLSILRHRFLSVIYKRMCESFVSVHIKQSH